MRLINPEIRIEPTNLCNANCIMCPRELLTRPKSIMPYEHCKNLINQAKDLGVETITHCGLGEPLIDSNLEAKIGYSAMMGLQSYLLTNASLLHKERSHQIIDSGLNMMRFSIHSLNREGFEKIHVGLNFYNVMSNIQSFLDLNTRMNNPITTQITALALNGESIDDIRNFWEHKVDYLEIWQPHNWAGQKQYRGIKRQKNTCGRPFKGPLQINVDGKMMVCCMDSNAEMIVGDTYTDTIEDIVRGEPYREIRRKHIEGTLNGLPCERCDQLNEEEESPLLYSNRDKDRKTGRTSSLKFNLEDKGE